MSDLEMNVSKHGTNEYFSYKKAGRHGDSNVKERSIEKSYDRKESSVEKERSFGIGGRKVPAFEQKLNSDEQKSPSTSYKEKSFGLQIFCFTRLTSIEYNISKPKRKKPSMAEIGE